MHWEKVSSPRVWGGLGIRSAHSENLALLAKVGWEILSDKQSLACEVIKNQYLLDSPAVATASSTWRGVLKCRGLLRAGSKWLIGSGTNINFWNDWWVGSGPLITVITPDLDPNLAALTVADVLSEDKLWDLSLVQHLLPLDKVL